MGKTCSEVSSINIHLLLPWNVDIVTIWTVNFDATCRQLFRKPKRENALPFTKHSRARSKCTHHVLFLHQLHAMRCYDISSVDQPVKIHSWLILLKKSVTLVRLSSPYFWSSRSAYSGVSWLRIMFRPSLLDRYRQERSLTCTLSLSLLVRRG